DVYAIQCPSGDSRAAYSLNGVTSTGVGCERLSTLSFQMSERVPGSTVVYRIVCPSRDQSVTYFDCGLRSNGDAAPPAPIRLRYSWYAPFSNTENASSLPSGAHVELISVESSNVNRVAASRCRSSSQMSAVTERNTLSATRPPSFDSTG